MRETKKARILFISLRSDYGGGPTHMFDIVTHLNSSFGKYVACPIQKPFYNMYKGKNIKLFSLPVRTFSLFRFVELVWFAKRNYIDIIHSHGKGAGVYSRVLGLLIGKPVIHTFHGIHYKRYSYLKQKLYFIIERIMSWFTWSIINVSVAEHEEGMRLKLFPKSKAQVIYNGVNIREIRSSSMEIELRDLINSIKKDNTLICTVARFDYVKGIDVAIQAMKSLKKYHKNFKYILIGDGELKKAIIKEINDCRLNNQILLLGFRDDVPGILKMMDIYLSPSREESMSLTLLEAKSSGLPIVATDIPGNRDLIKGGLLARSEDPLDIASKINMLINDPELKYKLSKEGKIDVKESYTLERMIRNTENLYNELLSPKKLFKPMPRISKRRKTRIGINASKIFDVHTGVGRYTYNLCRYILKTGSKNDYYFYTPGRMGNTIKTDVEGTHLEKPTASIQNNILRILWEQIILPIYSRKDRLDLFHYTDHALSLFQSPQQVIITVHDIAYIRFPDLLNKSRQIYKKYILRESIKRASIIVADSYSTKRDIVEFFGINEEKIKVVHLGVESRFRPIGNVKEYRLKNKLHSKMILNVGTLEPRKNVITLMKAFKKLREKGFEAYKLVIAGEKGWLYTQIFKEVEHSGLKNEILFLGVVKDEDLPALYNCADIFVYPSLYEGFGLPPLEAMACGIPVVTSNTSSLPEVIGDAGIMVDPDDVNSLCETMCNLLTDKELRCQMSKNGLKRAKLFSWEKAANEILEIYDDALSVYKSQ
ncbi:MAG: glycosyltransferase [Candidatus Scalindua sp.]|nr:glycosyltransferase [Candidatus Scalindua sp.]